MEFEQTVRDRTHSIAIYTVFSYRNRCIHSDTILKLWKYSAHLAIISLVCVEREQKIQYRFFDLHDKDLFVWYKNFS